MTLAQETCQPCRAGGTPLPEAEARELAANLPLWTRQEKQLERTFKFKDFRDAMVFVNRVAEAANEQDHHPDIIISYNKVRLVLSTHKVGGLSRNDFILAAHIEARAGGAV